MKLIDKNSHGGIISYLQSQATDSINKPSEMNMASGETSVPDNIKLDELID